MLSTEAKHGGFEMVQAKTFGPIPNPEIVVVGDNEFVIVPLPEINVQTPTPVVGVLAAMVGSGLVEHIVKLGPALAILGRSFTVSEQLDVVGGHAEVEMAHSKTFKPNPNPVIVVLGLNGEVTLPLPDTIVHTPKPIVGVLPAIKAFGELIQSV